MTTCQYFSNNKCSSCSLLSLDKNSLNDFHFNLLKTELKNVENNNPKRLIHPFETLPPFPSRSKAKFTVGGTTKNPIIGVIKKDLKCAELLNCPLHYNSINNLLPFLIKLITSNSLSPYNIKSRNGELKGLIIKSNKEENQLILKFILRSKKLIPKLEKLVPIIQTKFCNVIVITANIQSIPHQILEGPEEIILSKENHIIEKFNNYKLLFGSNSFSQVTSDIAEKLYEFVSLYLEKKSFNGFFDLFCGVGGFSFNCSKFIKWGIGVELSKDAIDYSIKGAELNNITNLEFIASDVLKFLQEYKSESPEVILINPPRRGLGAEIINEIKKIEPKTIIYSSCNIKTLVLDINLLKNYELVEIKPFDMFPLTKHMEVLTILEHK